MGSKLNFMKLLLLLFILPVALIAQTPLDQGKVLYESKKLDQARKIFQSIDDDDRQYSQAQYYLGRIAFDQKNWDDAEDFLEEAIDADGKVADFHLWLGHTLGNMIGDANMLRKTMIAPKLRDAYARAVELKPDLVDAHWGLMMFCMEAPSVMGGGLDKAKAEAQVIAKYSEADGHRAMGVIYNKEQKFSDAEKEFTLAWKANPKYTGPLLNFYANRKEYVKAMEFIDPLLKSEPENYLLIYQFGKLSALSGQQLDRGLEYLNKYLSYTPKTNEPSHAGAQMRLGQIYEKKGNKGEAKKRYELALKTDPTLSEAKEGLARVSK